MPPATSAGILLWRRRDGAVQVLIAHMGGPFWARKDAGAWSLPKGEYDAAAEDPRAAAVREWREELGLDLPVSPEDLVAIGEVRQRSGKRLTVWAGEGDVDPEAIVPGTFEMQWPPRSGRTAEFPEVDRVRWCALDEARALLVAGQQPLLDRLVAMLG